MKLNELGRWVLERQNNSRPSLKHAKPQNKIEREGEREAERDSESSGDRLNFRVRSKPAARPRSGELTRHRST